MTPDGAVGIAAERGRLDAGLEAHGHDALTILVVAAGTLLHRTAAGSLRLQRGSVEVIPAGAWHSLDDPDGALLHAVSVAPSVLRHELGWALHDPALGRVLRPAEPDAPPLRIETAALHRIESSCDELERAPRAPALDRAVRLAHLLLILGELAVAPEWADPAPAPHPAVACAARMLQQQHAARWTLDELAQVVNLAPGYLSRLFRQQLGLPPMAYLDLLRAERMSVLLAETSLPVSTVGAMVGWSDPSYAGRRFRVSFGVSPARYRALGRPERPTVRTPHPGSPDVRIVRWQDKNGLSII